MVTYSRCTTENELRQILKLQQENLPTAVSEDRKKTDGFVTVLHTFDLLKAMNDTCPHIIAKENNTVIGYTLCMDPKFGDTLEVLRPMFKEIENALSDAAVPLASNSNYIVMGQVCIATEFRKQGIFRKLYETMKRQVLPPYEYIITEVDATNIRSINAHYAVGFRKLSTYRANGQDWELIYL